MSERSERPVGERTGRPAESSSQDAQIRTLLDRQKERILAECQAEIKKHEFQYDYDRRSLLKLSKIIESQQEELHCAQAEELQRRDQQLLHETVIAAKIRNYAKLIIKVSMKWRNSKKFQSSTFDTIARRRVVEDQDTILELIGKIQDLQNEINCMNDSKIFRMLNQFAVEIPTLTVDQCHSHLIPIPEGMLSRSMECRAAEKGRQAFGDTHGISGTRFCKSRCVIISTLSAGIESMEFRYRRAVSFIHSGKE